VPEPAPFLRPIDRAWLATGPYGAPNYDEFAGCDAVRAAASARPASIVAVDNPQCYANGLAASGAGLAAMKAAGRYLPARDVVLLYEMGDARAVVGLIATEEISSAAGESGRLWRNEEVFADKVAERRALLEALRHVISPVLLVPGDGARFGSLLAAAVPTGPPLVIETDEHGVSHRLWPLIDPDPVLTELARQVCYVADGNHRSLAAQQSGLGACLAVVADPAGLRIEAYHRLLRLEITGAQLLAAAGPCRPVPVAARDPAATHLYVAGGLYRLDLPVEGGPVDRLPHTVLERLLLVGALGLDPAAVTYVGGDGVAAALVAEVDSGRATGALLMRPVTTAEFVAVGAARLPMPRKSTWFTPKARSGLVLAEL
jgi:uncharacterized protein (DUF1015 family)